MKTRTQEIDEVEKELDDKKNDLKMCEVKSDKYKRDIQLKVDGKQRRNDNLLEQIEHLKSTLARTEADIQTMQYNQDRMDIELVGVQV